MRRYRVRFTIRALMIAIMAVGVGVALLREWRDLLPFSSIVLLPIGGLAALRTQVAPPPSWRHEVPAGLMGWGILGAGWLWARCLIWKFQRQEGFVAIGGATQGKHYEYWALTVPGNVTAVGLILYAVLLTVACAPRRRRGVWPVLMGHLLALAAAYIWFFAGLAFEAFD